MAISVKISPISTFSLFFLVFNHDFVIRNDFNHVAASGTANYDITKVTHRIFNTNL